MAHYINVKNGLNVGGAITGTTYYGDGSNLENLPTVDPSVDTIASSSSLTIDSSVYDMYTVTALAEAMTINAPTGSPAQGRRLTIRIKDNGTARALTWDSIFRAIGVTLPTTTTINKLLYVTLIYNSNDIKWDCIAVNEEA